MILKDMIGEMEKTWPKSAAESWDNPGLQAGRLQAEIKKVYIALDANEENIEGAAQSGAQLLLTHHPLLIAGLKNVTDESVNGRRVLKLLTSGVAHYAMHTNFDVVTMGELAADRLQLLEREVLEVTGTDPKTGLPSGIGTAGLLPREMSGAECAAFVKEAFGLPSVKVFGDPEKRVRRAAVCPGSGHSTMPSALAKHADVYITGDIGHHDGLDAVDASMLIIDAGHYGVEHIYIAYMEAWVKAHFPELAVETAPIHHPFRVF